MQLAYYFEASRTDPFIVDGGSEIRDSVLFKALYPEAHVLAFEPRRVRTVSSSRNVEANSLSGVEVHHAALGGEAGDVPFFEDPMIPATFRNEHQARTHPAGRASSVSQLRLSEFLTGEVDLLKLDIEGAEDAVLGDLIESEAIARVDQVIVEYHHQLDPLDPARDSVDRFLGFLRQQGFTYRVSAADRVNERRSTAASGQDVLVFARRRS